MHICTQCKEETRFLIAKKCYGCFNKIQNSEEPVLTKTQANDIINNVIDNYVTIPMVDGAYTKAQVEEIIMGSLSDVRMQMVDELRKL